MRQLLNDTVPTLKEELDALGTEIGAITAVSAIISGA